MFDSAWLNPNVSFVQCFGDNGASFGAEFMQASIPQLKKSLPLEPSLVDE